jgi:hypothetical protein
MCTNSQICTVQHGDATRHYDLFPSYFCFFCTAAAILAAIFVLLVLFLYSLYSHVVLAFDFLFIISFRSVPLIWSVCVCLQACHWFLWPLWSRYRQRVSPICIMAPRSFRLRSQLLVCTSLCIPDSRSQCFIAWPHSYHEWSSKPG